MKTYFSYRTCDRCGKRHDATADHCPNCNREFDFEGKQLFENDVHVGWIKNLIFFLIGMAGFQLLGTALATISQTIYLTQWSTANPNATSEAALEAVKAYIATVDYSMLINGVAYGIITIALLAVLGKGIKDYLRGWKGWKPYVAGLVGFFALIMISYVWGFVVQLIRPDTGSNANQNTLIQLAIAYPVLSIIIFGVLGPVCEEFTYRIGLFSFTKRFSRVLAYIVTPLVFGFIHFGWSHLGDGTDAIIVELLNIPDYILAGLLLSYLYDKFGIGASTTAHVLNNLLSFIQILILHANGQL